MKNSSLNSQFGAFACASSGGYQAGLTKREYFAGLAMQGILANPSVGKIIDGERFVDKIAVSQSSVIIADEILKQLENETTK